MSQSALISLALAAGLIVASPAAAATLRDCDGITDRAYNVVEPWEKNSRTFYKGMVRVTYLDTGGEPACCSAHLLITFYAEGEGPENLVCQIVSAEGATGFGGLGFSAMTSSYDPRKGLLLTVPYSTYGEDGRSRPAGTVKVRIILQTGDVRLEP